MKRKTPTFGRHHSSLSRHLNFAIRQSSVHPFIRPGVIDHEACHRRRRGGRRIGCRPARRLSEDAQIVLFERGADVSFANCGMPYYLGGEIAERGKLLVVPVERLRSRYKLDVRPRSAVESIDRAAKTIRVRDLANGREYEESYDKLILAPGPARGCRRLRASICPASARCETCADTDRIKAAIDAGLRQAVILGGGFIGLELAENFVRRGIAVTIVEKNDQVLAPLDPEMTTPIAERTAAHGVELLLDEAAEAIESGPDGLTVRLSSGRRLGASWSWWEWGCSPRAGWPRRPAWRRRARRHRGQRATANQRPGHLRRGRCHRGHATSSPARRRRSRWPARPTARDGWRPITSSAARCNTAARRARPSCGVFSRTAAITGASEKGLRRAGQPFRKVYVHPAQHVGYYPGAEAMALKLLFDPQSGRVLGAQAVGGAGVDKRIDVLAMAVQAGMTVFDLEESELAYSPQYGAAKDPVNMAGFVAAGIVAGRPSPGGPRKRRSAHSATARRTGRRYCWTFARPRNTRPGRSPAP